MGCGVEEGDFGGWKLLMVSGFFRLDVILTLWSDRNSEMTTPPPRNGVGDVLIARSQSVTEDNERFVKGN
jgi:hypothetical protein